MGEYQEQLDAEGLKPTKYILGDKEADDHDHVIYLRDDLPIATTSSESEHYGFHAHSILKGMGNTIVCVAEQGHTHTTLAIEEAGNYAPRTLFNG